MIYVALLRGINVGGNNKVDMKLLKASFESLGLSDVKTYINSGNIVFSDQTRTSPELVELLQATIVRDFALSIKVLIRNVDQYKKVVAALPTNWTNDKTMKSDVMFLWDEVDSPTVIEQLQPRSGVDTATYVPGAVLWSAERDVQGKSSLNKLVGTKLYGQMTVRNVNTVRRIWVLMQDSVAK